MQGTNTSWRILMKAAVTHSSYLGLHMHIFLISFLGEQIQEYYSKICGLEIFMWTIATSSSWGCLHNTSRPFLSFSWDLPVSNHNSLEQTWGELLASWNSQVLPQISFVIFFHLNCPQVLRGALKAFSSLRGSSNTSVVPTQLATEDFFW